MVPCHGGPAVNRSRFGSASRSFAMAALRKVPRHRFVPTEMRSMAYMDAPLPIGPNGGFQELFKIRKKAGRVEKERSIPVSFVPLVRKS